MYSHEEAGGGKGNPFSRPYPLPSCCTVLTAKVLFCPLPPHLPHPTLTPTPTHTQPSPTLLLPALLPVPAAVHEAGHWVAARQRSVELAPPLLIPAGLGLLGSFGAITRIKSVVPDRAALGAVATAGPLAGEGPRGVVFLHISGR